MSQPSLSGKLQDPMRDSIGIEKRRGGKKEKGKKELKRPDVSLKQRTRTGSGRDGLGRAGQGRAEQGRAPLSIPHSTTLTMKFTYLQLCQDTPVLLNYTGSGEEFQQQCLLNILKIPRVW